MNYKQKEHPLFELYQLEREREHILEQLEARDIAKRSALLQSLAKYKPGHSVIVPSYSSATPLKVLSLSLSTYAPSGVRYVLGHRMYGEPVLSNVDQDSIQPLP